MRIVWLSLIGVLSGCTAHSGWRTCYEVSPVSAISDHRSFDAEKLIKAKKDGAIGVAEKY